MNGALLSASEDELAVVTIQKNRFLELEDCMKTVGFLESVRLPPKSYKDFFRNSSSLEHQFKVIFGVLDFFLGKILHSWSWTRVYFNT